MGSLGGDEAQLEGGGGGGGGGVKEELHLLIISDANLQAVQINPCYVVQLGLHPIFKRLQNLSDNQVFNKGREVADDMRERWETSDSAVVQRLQVPYLCAVRAGASMILYRYPRPPCPAF